MPTKTTEKRKTMNLNYRKKPIVVHAWQFTRANYEKGVPALFCVSEVELWIRHGGSIIGGCVHTLEGEMKISENDWIIHGVRGEYYPCKPDVFAASYEPA